MLRTDPNSMETTYTGISPKARRAILEHPAEESQVDGGVLEFCRKT